MGIATRSRVGTVRCRPGIVFAPVNLLTAVILTIVVLVGLMPTASAAAAPVNQSPPSVAGAPVFGSALVADPGAWTPTGVVFGYQWLADGTPIPGATNASFTPGLAQIGQHLSVAVTATDPLGGATATAVSASTGPVALAQRTLLERPAISGSARLGKTLKASGGAWSSKPQSISFQWFRGDRLVPGATQPRHRVTWRDVGKRLTVRVEATSPGFEPLATSTRAVKGLHRTAVRRVATYSVQTRGKLRVDRESFARAVAATYADPRGWRGRGVVFRRVSRGGDFTLVLAAAAQVPSFSSECSVEWSCRVGRYVIVNQTRWLKASTEWRAAGAALRGYQHMVVNHETGHWLGFGHAYCPAPGRKAPVMQQQSKGLQGCRVNPWPTLSELTRGSTARPDTAGSPDTTGSPDSDGTPDPAGKPAPASVE